MNHHAVVLALISAALFGVSTPAAKLLLGAIDPTILAGLLYCGAGIGIGLLRRLAKVSFPDHVAEEAPLQRHDIPWLAAAPSCLLALSALCFTWRGSLAPTLLPHPSC